MACTCGVSEDGSRVDVLSSAGLDKCLPKPTAGSVYVADIKNTGICPVLAGSTRYPATQRCVRHGA